MAVLSAEARVVSYLKGMSQDTLVRALNSIEEAVVIYDADGRLVWCNCAFKSLYGYTDEQVTPGVHFSELGRIDITNGNVAIGDQYSDGEDYLRRKAEYRKTLKGSFIVHLKNGRWIKTTDRATPDGGFISVQSEITDIMNLTSEIEAARAKAEKLAITDTLTRLSNRHRLEEVLSYEWTQIQRYARNLSVILFDIDDFKSVNDNHGHPAGDAALVEIARLFRRCVRSTDVAGRWGGEEFMAICPETDLSGAVALAECIRGELESNPIDGIGRKTASFGVAKLLPGETVDGLIKRADSALYAAKSLGRNRVVTAG